MKMPKKSPVELARESSINKRQTSWDYLSAPDREYIIDVVDAMKKQPRASVYRAAEALISELSLPVSHATMVRILKGLMNA